MHVFACGVYVRMCGYGCVCRCFSLSLSLCMFVYICVCVSERMCARVCVRVFKKDKDGRWRFTMDVTDIDI